MGAAAGPCQAGSDHLHREPTKGTVFDLGRDLRHQPPAPASDAGGPAQQAVFCD
ncbi:hypothetical protein ABH931_001521 [Streptacidiphilus sp. MAP12-33]|uniref:hypothetical protein n=1 Tax=Streptacidiphilus sp. MAP12-33 TaxID=3156266 RepID=UPI00351589DF